jgi:hypothetical protein
VEDESNSQLISNPHNSLTNTHNSLNSTVFVIVVQYYKNIILFDTTYYLLR